MAEGGYNLEQLLPQVTKQQAVDNLTKIISNKSGRETEIDKEATELLKYINENYDKSDDALSLADRKKYHEITLEAHISLHNLMAMRQILGIEVRQGNVVQSVNGPLAVLDEKLNMTKIQLQDAKDNIAVLKQELTQVRLQINSERNIFENERMTMHGERREREEEIRALKTTIIKLGDNKIELEKKIRELQSDKEGLEKQIRDLRIQMEEEKAANEKYKREQDELVQKLRTNVDGLMIQNEKLKSREPYKLVGYSITLITNALYKFVHAQAQLKKKYYSIDDLENHLKSRYRENEEGRRSAEKRWEDIKEKIGWNDDTPALLNLLAENREKGPCNFNVPVNYTEFSEAVRVMFKDKELDQNEMELIRDLFVKCDDNLEMQPLCLQ